MYEYLKGTKFPREGKSDLPYLLILALYFIFGELRFINPVIDGWRLIVLKTQNTYARISIV